jgi:hypothetical protein
MDRRRFIPGPEGMETRMMLSTATAATPVPTNAVSTTAVGNVPYTIQQKLERIDRIPINMRATAPNRVLPQPLIGGIQEGMRDAISTMNVAAPETIETFNDVLRDVVSRPSLRAQDARALNNAFTQVLVSAGAPTEAIDKIATNLEDLATTVNTSQGLPVFLTTNDYALVLQMTLIVGRPMPAPAVPNIARDSGTQADPRTNISRTPQPTFVGSYESRAQLQIFDDATGEVYGEAQSGTNGRYSITFGRPLDLGTYRLRIRALDEMGHVGQSSGVFTLRIVEPRGPQG